MVEGTNSRRRFRFSLQTLLICVASTAVPLAWLHSEWRLVNDRADFLATLQVNEARREEVARAEHARKEAIAKQENELLAEFKYDEHGSQVWQAVGGTGYIRSFAHVERAGHPTIPFWRIWLGDQAQYQVHFRPGALQAEIEQARKLFPEAVITGVPDLAPAE